MPGSKQAWPNRAACWSPAMPLIGMPAAMPASPDAVTPNRPDDGRTSGNRSMGMPNRSHRGSDQRAGTDVEQQGAAGVGHVGGVHGPGRGRAAGQVPQDPGVDGPEGQVRPGRHPARTEEPLQLGAREVGVEHQPGGRPHQIEVALLAQLVAAGRGAAVLPHDGPSHRLAGGAVPDHRGLALVGDADGGHRLVQLAVTWASVAATASQISTASCSTQPGWGKYWGNSR